MEEQEWNGVLDARMKRMWDFYASPKSTSFNNAKQSAIKAGYSDRYSNNITGEPWFKMKKRRMNLLGKAEKVLEKSLDMITIDLHGMEQADLLRVQADVAKFIAKTQGKDEGYSERTELTGKGGEGIVFMPVELMEKYNLNNNKMEETIQNMGETVVEEVPEVILPVDPQDANICEGCE